MIVRPGEWAPRVATLLASFGSPTPRNWRGADKETIRHVVMGISPYSGKSKPNGAARVVFNISSAHIPGFVTGPADRAYKNRYDVNETNRVGDPVPSSVPDARAQIDQMLAALIGQTGWTNLYYGAVELNGAGIRYYGDVSLVLKIEEVAPGTLVINRNSFDLICAPLRERTHSNDAWDPSAAENVATEIAGEWAADLADMAAHKILQSALHNERRITVGEVSDGVLADEDYLEVIRAESFGPDHVEEARLSAADAAVDGLVADRLRRGPLPGFAELLWRHRRRKADQALKSKRIRTRVVVSSGRVRS